MSSRLERLAASLDEPFLVLDPTNVEYLTGFASSNPALYVEPGATPKLFSDFRYAERGRAVEGVEFVEATRDTVADLAQRLSGRVGFESEFVTYARWETLGSGGLELVPRRGVVEALRAVKDEAELAAIRRAAEITNAGYERLAQERFVGRTELELVRTLEGFFRAAGAEGLAFDAIVAAGANGASPHADPGERVLAAGDLVVVDSGASSGGYCSDCTRTFAAGEPPERLREAYAVCLEAQLAGLAAVRAGVTGVDADRAARDVIVAAGLGEAFGHGLGHGVGLAIHEAPTLSRISTDTLAAGMVVTIEPGVYLEGLGGIRIEDLVVVTDGEPEILTRFTKELVVVD